MTTMKLALDPSNETNQFTEFESIEAIRAQSKVYDLGLPELPNVKITFSNGIMVKPEEAHVNPYLLSDYSNNQNVTYVYVATQGTIMDLIKAGVITNFDIYPIATELLLKTWEDYLHNNPQGTIFHVCHSYGCEIAKSALILAPKEMRKRINVLAVAPATYIHRNYCQEVVHLVAKGDLVPFKDIKGRMMAKAQGTLHVIPRHPEGSVFPHGFTDATYHDAIQEWLKGTITQIMQETK